MSGLWAKLVGWLRSLFWKQEMELTLIGLQEAGKTTLLHAICGDVQEDTIPTVGLNTRKVTKGKVSIKLWDLGGQPRFRQMWERYCRGASAIVMVVDSANQTTLQAASKELHELMSKPSLAGIPVLVLGNKNDLEGALTVQDLIDAMDLKSLQGREICCYSISAKKHNNIDVTLEWLIAHSRKSSG